MSRLQELENAQQRTWEEKERISLQLEQERQSNMNTAISQAVGAVKQHKVETLKSIKRHQRAREVLTKRMKAGRERYDLLKGELQQSMSRYQALQSEYDERDGDPKSAEALTVEGHMSQLLDSIEKQREAVLLCRADMEHIKQEGKNIDTKLVDERADLASDNALLDQNEKLRAAIVAEEREKFASEKDAYLQSALAAEKTRLKRREVQVERSMEEIREEGIRREVALTLTIKELERSLGEAKSGGEKLKEELEDMTNNLAETEVTLELAEERAAELEKQLKAERAQHKKQVLDLEKKLEMAVDTVERMGGLAVAAPSAMQAVDEGYCIVKNLMHAFERERRNWARKGEMQAALMQSALADVIFLNKRKALLENELKCAVDWDPYY